VYGSTGGITGAGAPGTTMAEDAPAAPPNPYNLTKHLAEQALTAYRWPFGVSALRYYAPYARDGSNPMIAHLLACLRDDLPIEVGADDGPWMNPVHISDAVALTVPVGGPGRVARSDRRSQRWISWGSSASRSPSPTRFTASTTVKITNPGGIQYHGKPASTNSC
jgi:hypothetical protein